MQELLKYWWSYQELISDWELKVDVIDEYIKMARCNKPEDNSCD